MKSFLNPTKLRLKRMMERPKTYSMSSTNVMEFWMPVNVTLPGNWSCVQPSIENVNVGDGGFGPPNPIQSKNEMAHAILSTAP